MGSDDDDDDNEETKKKEKKEKKEKDVRVRALDSPFPRASGAISLSRQRQQPKYVGEERFPNGTGHAHALPIPPLPF